MTAPDSVDAAGWLRQRLARRNPDVLRTMVKPFADALMSAEADAVCGAEYGQRSDERVNSAQRLPGAGVGHPRRHGRAGDPEAAHRVVLPGLAAGAPPPGRAGPGHGRGHQLPARGVDAAGGEAGRAARRRRSCRSRRSRRWPRTSTRRSRRSAAGPLDASPYTFVSLDALTMKVREDGRTVNVHALVAVGVNADGHREVLGLDVVLRGGRRRLAGVPALPDRPRPVRRAAGHLRRPPRPGQRDRGGAARRGLAALPHPLPAQPAHRGAEVGAAVGGHHGAHDLRPARRRRGRTPSSPGSSTPSPRSTPPRPSTSTTPATTCWRSPRSRTRSGGRSGRTTRRSG